MFIGCYLMDSSSSSSRLLCMVGVDEVFVFGAVAAGDGEFGIIVIARM